jgi:hypothetical protein
MIGKSIELDKMRTLRFDFNAMADFEDVYGKSLMEILATGAISFSAIRALLWAGLKHEDRQLAAAGPARAGEIAQDWMEKSGGDAADLTKMVTDALIESGFVKVEPAGDGDTGPDTTEGDDSGNC